MLRVAITNAVVAAAVVVCCLVGWTHAALGPSAGPTFPELSGVLVLTNQTFLPATQRHNPLLVLFDSSARKGSVTLFQRFADAASALRLYHWNATKSTRFATIDVDDGLLRLLPEQVRVLGLPTVVRFRCNFLGNTTATTATTATAVLAAIATSCMGANGDMEVYNGGKTSAEFQRYVIGEPVREVHHVTRRRELDGIIRAKPLVALFLVEGTDTLAYFDCKTLAQVDADTSTYVASTNAFILEEEDEDGDGSPLIELQRLPALVVFREFGREYIVFEDEWKRATLFKFLQLNRYTVLANYNRTESSYFYDRAAVAHVLMFSDSAAPYHGELLAQLEQVAMVYYDNRWSPNIRFVVVGVDELALRNALVVPDEHLPAVLLVPELSLPPERIGVFGESLVAELTSGRFIISALDYLMARYPLLDPTDIGSGGDTDGDGIPDVEIPAPPVDWRDYSDLFADTTTVVLATGPRVGVVVAEPTGLAVSPLTAPEAAHETRGVEETPQTGLTVLQPLMGRAVSSWPPEVLEDATTDEILELRRGHTVLVLLHSPRCFSCRLLEGVVDDFVRRQRGAADLASAAAVVDVVARVNVDEVDPRALGAWVEGIPMLPGLGLLLPPEFVAVYRNDAGAPTAERLLSFVREHLVERPPPGRTTA